MSQVIQLGPAHTPASPLPRVVPNDLDFFQMRRIGKELHLHASPLNNIAQHERSVHTTPPNSEQDSGE